MKLHSYSRGKHYLPNLNSNIILLILVHTYTVSQVACCMATVRALERDSTFIIATIINAIAVELVRRSLIGHERTAIAVLHAGICWASG